MEAAFKRTSAHPSRARHLQVSSHTADTVRDLWRGRFGAYAAGSANPPVPQWFGRNLGQKQGSAGWVCRRL